MSIKENFLSLASITSPAICNLKTWRIFSQRQRQAVPAQRRVHLQTDSDTPPRHDDESPAAAIAAYCSSHLSPSPAPCPDSWHTTSAAGTAEDGTSRLVLLVLLVLSHVPVRQCSSSSTMQLPYPKKNWTFQRKPSVKNTHTQSELHIPYRLEWPAQYILMKYNIYVPVECWFGPVNLCRICF